MQQNLNESPSTTCLEVKDLQKTYGDRRVVDGLSFEVAKGEIVGLLGPNGAGKTTAFYMTVGLIRPDRGQVIFNGVDVTQNPMHERARMGMGYLAQEPSVFRHLTVEENILCILESLSLSKKEQKVRLEQLLEELHLTPLAKKMAVALSGGERRRLEITRALITNPTLLMLDEPFANIDPISVQEVKQLIVLLSQKGISILITDHNAREIFSVVHRSYLVSEGKVMLSGPVEELVNNEEARRTYLGMNFKL
ncbi:MAG: LPS export ABC transporter ATP-binding protein [Parachlamydiaceae bacterium]|nr:LPS export ABC transporter ATP-binding protein [Parachlamydiaceae bacterium]